MKKITKLATLFLTGAMLLAALTACGQQPKLVPVEDAKPKNPITVQTDTSMGSVDEKSYFLKKIETNAETKVKTATNETQSLVNRQKMIEKPISVQEIIDGGYFSTTNYARQIDKKGGIVWEEFEGAQISVASDSQTKYSGVMIFSKFDFVVPEWAQVHWNTSKKRDVGEIIPANEFFTLFWVKEGAEDPVADGISYYSPKVIEK